MGTHGAGGSCTPGIREQHLHHRCAPAGLGDDVAGRRRPTGPRTGRWLRQEIRRPDRISTSTSATARSTTSRRTVIPRIPGRGSSCTFSPVDMDDLPPHRRRYGFDNRDFSFTWRGGFFDGKCLTQEPLPGLPRRPHRDRPVRERRRPALEGGDRAPGTGRRRFATTGNPTRLRLAGHTERRLGRGAGRAQAQPRRRYTRRPRCLPERPGTPGQRPDVRKDPEEPGLGGPVAVTGEAVIGRGRDHLQPPPV